MTLLRFLGFWTFLYACETWTLRGDIPKTIHTKVARELPPRETSKAAKSEEKRMFSQANIYKRNQTLSKTIWPLLQRPHQQRRKERQAIKHYVDILTTVKTSKSDGMDWLRRKASLNTWPFVFSTFESVFSWKHGVSLRSKRFLASSSSWDKSEKKKRMRGQGEGKEGNACLQTPRFWKTAFAHERSFWLVRCG